MTTFTSALLSSELGTGFVLVAEAPNLLFKTIDFVMGNDVAVMGS